MAYHTADDVTTLGIAAYLLDLGERPGDDMAAPLLRLAWIALNPSTGLYVLTDEGKQKLEQLRSG